MCEVLISIIIFVIISRAHIDLYPIIGSGRPAHKTAQTTCQEVLTWAITALLRTNHQCLLHPTTCLHGAHMGLTFPPPIKCFLSLLAKFWSEWDIVSDLSFFQWVLNAKLASVVLDEGFTPLKKCRRCTFHVFFTTSPNWVGPFAVSAPISLWR